MQEVSKKLDLFACLRVSKDRRTLFVTSIEVKNQIRRFFFFCGVLFVCRNLYLCWIYNTSNNIESQDGNSRITLRNLKKLEKTNLADISSLLKDFVGATVGFISVSFYLHRVSLNISTYSVLFNNDMQQDILDFLEGARVTQW